MAKTCNNTECNNPQFGGGYCRYHQWQRTDKKKPKRLRKSVLKSVYTAYPKGGKSTIKPISNKELNRLKKYRPIRDKFLKENPTCMICGCEKTSTLHHAKGRLGDLLWTVEYFRNLCWTHHEYYERHPQEAYDLGLSIKRI